MANPAWADHYPQHPQLGALLDSLNEHQLKAASVGTGQASLIGVPGSGKTRTIVARIARLAADGIDPDYILAMTFTRAAATEMTERLRDLGVVGARVGTIHSVARQIVAAETDLFDHGELDEGWKLFYELKKLLSDMRKSSKLPSRGVDLDCVSRFIEACKACGPCYVFNDPWGLNVRSEEFIMRQARKWGMYAGLRPQRLVEIYTEMERRRVSCGLYDYNDMQLWSWMHLVADEVAREKWRSRWSVVIVDEAQDSNQVQWDLARFLTGMESCIDGLEEFPNAPVRDDGNHNLMVGGDPSQSIYGWRHAVPKEFVDFTSAPETEMLVLPINYRSNDAICSVGTSLVKGKKWHLAGDIKPHSEAKVPNAVTIRRFDNPELEASAVLDSVMEIAQTQQLRSSAVLARLRIGLDMAEIECIRRRIRYIKRASGSFLESREVKDVLAYMRVAAGHDPDGKWIKHLINRPFRYIGKVFINRCEDQAALKNISLLDAIVDMKGSLSYRQRRTIDDLVKLLKDMNKIAVQCEEREAHAEKMAKDNAMVVDGKLSMDVIDRLAEREEARNAAEAAGETMPEEPAEPAPEVEDDPDEPVRGPADLITMMLDRTHYIEAVRREEGLAGMDESKLAIFGELHRMASMFRTPSQFLAYIDGLKIAVRRAQKSGLRAREAGAEDALVLSTIHSAKGLEWNHVFLVDVVEGRFPCARSEDYEEELRLLYVAITRAAQSCTVSYSGPAPSHDDRIDRAQGRVSPFITLVRQGLDKLEGGVTAKHND
jgi:DNA helicase-2/ATP-dependent DNA helicase PcrA